MTGHGTERHGGASQETGEQVRNETRLVARIVAGAAAGAVAAIPFLLVLGLLLAEAEWLARVDRTVATSLNQWAMDRSTVVLGLEVVERAMHGWVFRAAVLFAAALLWRAGARRLATWAVVTMAVGGLLNLVLKALIRRARPAFDDPVASADFFSFPSGHAQNSMLGVAVLLIVVLPALTRRGRAIAWTLGIFLVLLTGFDRVALGVHYVSDVIAGWLVALALVVGTAVAFRPPDGARRVLALPVDPAGSRRLRRGPDPQGEAAAAPGGVPELLTELRGLLRRLLTGAALIWVVVAALGLLVVALDDVLWPLTLEEDFLSWVAGQRTPTWTTIMETTSLFSGTNQVIVIVIVVAIAFRLAFGRWREGAFLVAAVSVEALAFVLATLVVGRSRPDIMITGSPPTSAFPSGHLAAALALYLSIALVLSRHSRHASGRVLAWVVLSVVPLAVAVSRVYLGAHYPSDYLGSLIAGGLAIVVAARLLLDGELSPQLHDVLDSSFRRRRAPLGPERSAPPD